MEENKSEIGQWLTGQNIFITGGTGFIGKVLIEKLLRSSPNVGTLYVMVRSNRGKSVEERLEALHQSKVFNRLNREHPGLAGRKIQCISGDILQPNMGISEADRQTLIENVTVVFHVAATVKFTEPLDIAILTNTRFTRDMVYLAKEMKKLQVFVHVSTAFCHCEWLEVEERFYIPLMDWQKAIKVGENLSGTELNAITDKILGNYPNTYTFTKNLAEHVVYDHRNELPFVIYRPVIVCQSRSEPEPGWTDILCGPVVFLLALGKGLVRSCYLPKEATMYYCPCDVTVNGMIASAWARAKTPPTAGHPLSNVVYNTTYDAMPAYEGIEICEKVAVVKPLPDKLWVHYVWVFTNIPVFTLFHVICNVIPGAIFEIVLKLMGRNIRVTHLLRKFYYTTFIYEKFTKNQFIINFNNFSALQSKLSPIDREIYDMDLFKPGETFLSFSIDSLETTLALIGDKNYSQEKSMKQHKMMVQIDLIFRLVASALILYFFPYTFVFNCVSSIYFGVSSYFQGIFEAV